VTLTGLNVATEVLAYATTHNVTKIVVGKPARPKWKDALFGSVVDELIRQSGEIDIYVIRGERSGEGERPQVDRQGNARQALDWPGYLTAVSVVLLATAVGWPLYHRVGIENVNILMLYLLGVLWVATRHSRVAAILASVLSVAAFDVMFVPPYYTFAISDRQYVVTFLVMLLTALVISALTHRVRLQAEGARQRERRTAALLGLSRDLAASCTTDQIASVTQQHAVDAVAGTAVLLLTDAHGKLHRIQMNSGAADPALDARELGAAQWAAEHAQPAGRGTNTLPTAAGIYVPLTGPRGVNGVMGILGGTENDGVFGPERRHMIDAFAAQAALAVERAKLADEAREAWEQVEAEFLRNTLLSGVSHELRTPLAGITGAATTLAERAEQLDDAQRREMLDTLVGEAGRMERLINNLLDMTRMEAGGLRLRKEWTPIDEVIGAALHHLDRRLQGRSVTTHIAPGLPLVYLDETAIEQVVANLLDNAVEYTPPGTPIEVRATGDARQISVEIADHGPGLPPNTEKRVFEKFFRARPGDGSPNRGVGLGLAISRGIVEAHGGTIRAANRPGGGAAFIFTLPVGGTPPAVEYDGQDQNTAA